MATVLQTILNGLAVAFQGRFEGNSIDAGLTPHSVIEIAGTGLGVNAGNPLPIGATSLPLPAGASTAALQPALNADGGALVHVTNLPATQAVSLAALPALAPGANVIGGVTISGTAAVSDPNNLAFQGAVAVTAGTFGTAGRSIGVNCTVAGNVIFTFPDASTLTVPVYVGWQTFPFAVTEVTLPGSGAATATFVNLK